MSVFQKFRFFEALSGGARSSATKFESVKDSDEMQPMTACGILKLNRIGKTTFRYFDVVDTWLYDLLKFFL